MNKKEKKKLAAFENKTRLKKEMLTKEMENADGCTKTLSQLWDKSLYEYESITMHKESMYYQRLLTRQMEFKDKVIQKLLDDLNEFKDICIRNSRNNLEMVNNTLSLFKSKIEDIHDRNKVEIKGGLLTNLDELQLIKNENDDYWKILKYTNKTIQIQTHQMNAKIKNKHIENMDLEKGRFESVTEKVRRKNRKFINDMNVNYVSILSEYKKRTESLMEDYYVLKEKEGNDLLKKYDTDIKKLSKKIKHVKDDMKESKSTIELCTLIKENQTFQNNLNKCILKVAFNSKCSQQYLSLLCQITKDMFYNKMNSDLEKGNKLIRIIGQCQKLETSKEQSNSFLRSNNNDNSQWFKINEILGKMSNFWYRVKHVKNSSKEIDDQIEKLQNEIIGLKKEIHLLINNNKNSS